MLVYTVMPGDTLYRIAQRHNTTVERILELNNIPDPDRLTVGMKLNIDAPSSGGGEAGAGRSDPHTSRFFDSVLFTLAADRSRYVRGETIRLTLVKVNTASSPVTLNYRTGQRFDLAAFQEGREVWRWLENRSFPQVTARVVLRPGQTQSFHFAWDQRDRAGRLIEPGPVTIRGYNLAEEFRNRPLALVVRVQPAAGPAPAPGVCPGGNLLTDPGLERWRNENTPVAWNGTNLFRTRSARTGSFAAGLGAVRREQATLTQSVAGLPGRIYQLRFWAREIPADPPKGSFTFNAMVFFYDAAGRFLTRADPVFTQTTIPERYTLFSLTTGLSPERTARAEVRFVFTPAPDNTSAVAIDEVDFRCV